MSKNDLSSSSKEITFYTMLLMVKSWFRYLLKRWWIIVLMGVSGGVAGFMVAYSEKPKYVSHLTFALEDGQGGLGGALNLAAEFGFNVGGSKNLFEGDNILTLLNSRRIIERVLLSVDTLDSKPISMADYFIKLSAKATKEANTKLPAAELRLLNVRFPAGAPRSSFTYLQDSVLMNLYKQFVEGRRLIVAKPDKKLNLYEISVISTDERFTKMFTDKLVKEATDFYVELKTKKSRETLEILQARVNQTKGSLNTAITSRAGIQDANVNPVFQQVQAQLQMKQVDISAYGGAYGELYKNLELARYQYLKDIPLLQVIDTADYPMEKIKKGKLMTALIGAFILTFITILILTATHLIANELNKNSTVDDNLATS